MLVDIMILTVFVYYSILSFPRKNMRLNMELLSAHFLVLFCVHFGGIKTYSQSETSISPLSWDLDFTSADFRKLYNSLAYVDKTLFIETFISKAESTVFITSPRRFGKSSIISMLKYFFTIQIDVNTLKLITPIESSPNYKMFQNLNIFKNQTIVQEYLGKRPVIHLDFGPTPIGIETIEKGYTVVSDTVSRAFEEHMYLLQSEKLDTGEKEQIRKWIYIEDWILNHPGYNLTDVAISRGIIRLSSYLEKHYNAKCVVLVDEYDAPGLAALYYGQTGTTFDNTTKLMVGLLNGLLKGNDKNVERAVVVGISYLFAVGSSKLNNVLPYRFLDNEKFSDYFGILESEFQTLMNKYNVAKDNALAAKNYYNGYNYKDKIFYCTFSVMNFIINLPKPPEPYWYKTEKLINFKKLLNISEVHNIIYSLVFKHNGIVQFIKIDHLTPEDVNKVNNILLNSQSGMETKSHFALHIFGSMLLEQGYLKIISKTNSSIRGQIPNIEIRSKLKSELQTFYVITKRLDPTTKDEIGEILKHLNFDDNLILNSQLLEFFKSLSKGVAIFCEDAKEKHLNEQVFRFFVLSMLESVAENGYFVTPEYEKIDIFMQRSNVKEFIIIELKHDNVHNGFFQILHREYHKPYENDKFIIMALNLRTEKNVCKIDMMYQINEADIHNITKLSFDKKNGQLNVEKVTVNPTNSSLAEYTTQSAAKEKLEAFRSSSLPK